MLGNNVHHVQSILHLRLPLPVTTPAPSDGVEADRRGQSQAGVAVGAAKQDATQKQLTSPWPLGNNLIV